MKHGTLILKLTRRRLLGLLAVCGLPVSWASGRSHSERLSDKEAAFYRKRS